MKTILNLKQCLILFAAVFSLTSCLKSDDPDFQIFPGGYVIQEVTEIPGGEGEDATYSDRFAPYVIAQAYNYEQIASCSASGGGSTMLMSKADQYGYVWITSIPTYSSAFPKDTYTIQATNAEGEIATNSVSFNLITKQMKGKLKGGINYDSNTKKLSVEFNKVENATEYIVTASTSSDANLLNTYFIATYTESQISGSLSLEESSFAKNLEAGETYYLSTAAIIGSSSTGNISVIQKGTKTITYTKASN